MKPINLRDEEVRGLLDGTRRMLVRPVKPQPEMMSQGFRLLQAGVKGILYWKGEMLNVWHGPFGSPGERLWVREAWGHDGPDLETVRQRFESASLGGTYGPYYRATESYPESIRWQPSIRMPRWASRLTLTTKSVRVVRVQEISEEDAAASGVPRNWIGDRPGWSADEHGYLDLEGLKATNEGREIPYYGHFTAKEAFESFWQEHHGKYPWDSNPWAWLGEVTAAMAEGGESDE